MTVFYTQLRAKQAELCLYRAMYLMKMADGLTGFIRIKILKRAMTHIFKGIKVTTNVKILKELVEWHDIAIGELVYEYDFVGYGFSDEDKKIFRENGQKLRDLVENIRAREEEMKRSKES